MEGETDVIQSASVLLNRTQFFLAYWQMQQKAPKNDNKKVVQQNNISW